ncbi:MAG TPA: helicase-related protein [Solirubrobacteraceae bacterium]
MTDRIDVDAELGRLKDFQLETVRYAYGQLFRDDDARRFLVADEVGLGKTLVARGVTALVVDELQRSGKVGRIDIVYVCSNADIARQNIRRLNVTGRDDVALASRITLLPLETHKLRSNEINLISLTPGTSLDPHSSLGVSKERAVLFWMLKEAIGYRRNSKSVLRALRGDAAMVSFSNAVASLDPRNHAAPPIDPGLTRDFVAAVEQRSELVEAFQGLCDRMTVRHETNAAWSEELRYDRREIVSDLRATLAQVCISALEPDLVILDEFQRFRDVLDNPDTAAGELAQQLFNWRDPESGTRARLLLLSATPYRMYTLGQEHETEDHQQDFMRTVRFLCGDDTETAAEIESAFADHKHSLINTAEINLPELRGCRGRIEAALGTIMCRTERLAVRDDRDGMLEHRDVATPLMASDVRGYLALQNVARLLKEPDVIEYWKSAPYLLNFMDGYRFKTKLEDAAESPVLSREVATAISRHAQNLSWRDVERYGDIDPGNPRMRVLDADVIQSGAWQALWIAPSLPYYALEGPYADRRVAGFTKRLVFSSWNVVPRAVAAMLTYAAERRMLRLLESDPRNTRRARDQRTQLLTFRISDGRLSSMPVLALLYPSSTLATLADPLDYAHDAAARGVPATVTGLQEWAEDRLSARIEALPAKGPGLRGPVDPSAHPYAWSGPEPWSITPEYALHLAFTERFVRLSRMTASDMLEAGFCREDLDLLVRIAGRSNVPTAAVFADACRQAGAALAEEEESASSRDVVDEGWYWAAPILLDLHSDPGATRAWWSRDNLAAIWAGDDTAEDRESRWADHVERARSLIRGDLTLGRRPDDLVATIVQLAVAGWGTVCARALTRVSHGSGHADVKLRDAAGQAAWGFRSLFNGPEVTAMVRSPDPSTAYWRHVLRYGTDGCLQAVVDEYAHVLVDDRGLFDPEPTQRWRVLAETIREALTLRATRVRVDRVGVDPRQGIKLTRRNMRTQFAARFGDERNADGTGGVRATQLRTAFNSPFWPFVLASTSVGQEGLDFHLYSHAIVHWNLPSNPVDLEQREGRIHRFKNHAVRRNVAQTYGDELMLEPGTDPWESLFARAAAERAPGVTDLVPYWLFPIALGARIERHVPTLPLSRDRARIDDLRRSLTVYRLAFGHARQEDLVAYLVDRFGAAESQRLAGELAIDLSPANLAVSGSAEFDPARRSFSANARGGVA